jgi:release factor glutamine methyltransferase
VTERTIRQALAEARRAGVDRLDAQLLLAHRMGRPRTWLIAHDEASLETSIVSAFADDVRRRADGVPLAYLTGWRAFHGLTLQVTPDVLDPRPDTETLVDWGLELLDGRLRTVPSPQVVDLGTGSGAIALALKQACPRATMRALDASAAALAVAKDNADRLGLAVAWVLSDWWQGLPAPRVDLALSNPPYIAGDDPHLAALRHEPAAALSPGGDGLGAIEAIVSGAPAHLVPGGWLLLEHGHDQADAVRDRLAAGGFAELDCRHDLAGHVRCSGGRWPG